MVEKVYLNSRMNAGEHAITQQPHGSHTHRQPHEVVNCFFSIDQVVVVESAMATGQKCDNGGGHNKGGHRPKGPSATAAVTGMCIVPA